MHINLSCYKNRLIFVEYLIYNKKYFINTYLMYGLYYWKSRDLKFILSLLFQFKLFIEEIRQIYFCPIYYGIKCFFAMDWLLLLGYHDYIFIRCLSFPFRKELIQHLQTAF